MAFENVFGNIDFQAQNKAARHEQQNFQQMIGNAIQSYQSGQDRKLKQDQLEQKKRELEAKAAAEAQEKLMDMDLQADNFYMKRAQGIPTTEAERAGAMAKAQTASDRMYTDPYGNQVIMPSGHRRAAQEAGLIGNADHRTGGFAPPSQGGGQPQPAQMAQPTQASYSGGDIVDHIMPHLIHQESRGDAMALSNKGAAGIAQIMPDTARDPGYGVKPLQGWDGKDPRTAPVEEQKRFGRDYLAAMIKANKGDPKLGLAAYNAGQGAVEQYGGVPPYKETQNYVDIIGRNAGLDNFQATGKFKNTPVGDKAELDAQKDIHVAEKKADIQFRKEQMVTDKGRQKVVGTIEKTMTDLERLNDKLKAKNAIITNNTGILTNLATKYGNTWLGRQTTGVTNSDIEAVRKEYETKRDSVIPSYIAYFDIPATVVDTEEMQKRILQSFGDPSLSHEVNSAALENMRVQFKLPKTSGGQQQKRKKLSKDEAIFLAKKRGLIK